MNAGKPISGYVTFVLHAHLPYVVHHGTWPHGQDWLHEAAAETYVPLLRVFAELEGRRTPLKCNLNLSPVLLEQMALPDFKAGFESYLRQKIEAARKDRRHFEAKGQGHFTRLAQFWADFYEGVARDFAALGGDLIAGFKRYYDSGSIEIITCGATHGYFALLGADASIRAQVRVGVETHQRFFGRRPRGIWLPECAYRPAGPWRYPVPVDGLRGPFQRSGVEQVLAEYGIEFFFVDTHLVEKNVRFTPYEVLAGDVPVAVEEQARDGGPSVYLPYYADTPTRDRARVAFFTRDARTGIQVWSGMHGYPGDPVYLEFHKKHWPGGHRYWQVTQSQLDLGAKTPYFPEIAQQQTQVHGRHFVETTRNVLEYDAPHSEGVPPVLCAPFDAELFGHWWFEGPSWLKHVAIEAHRPDSGIELVTAPEYLARQKPAGFVPLPEGSWGRNGTHEVWLNRDTEWTWKHIYQAELAVQQLVQSGRWRESEEARRLATQIVRELLLLESSDWQFLITTEHARDYAEKRFNEHLTGFNELLGGWRQFEAAGKVPEQTRRRLEELERVDSVFPEITPEVFA
ncbi:MAG TPA: 1,4-alpha-glucan branching protein domain-containing protein [Terriglobales bacterium]|nr:1,4-alpha-glucan branching protein domain-containing protein [Terriglobales bacterium]